MRRKRKPEMANLGKVFVFSSVFHECIQFPPGIVDSLPIHQFVAARQQATMFGSTTWSG